MVFSKPFSSFFRYFSKFLFDLIYLFLSLFLIFGPYLCFRLYMFDLTLYIFNCIYSFLILFFYFHFLFQNIKIFVYLKIENLPNEILIIYIPRRTRLMVIEDDLFIIFIDSILLDRVCFVMYIVAKRSIDCIFVYIKLFSPRFEQIESRYCYSEMFIRLTTSVKYSLQCLYRIQVG